MLEERPVNSRLAQACLFSCTRGNNLHGVKKRTHTTRQAGRCTMHQTIVQYKSICIPKNLLISEKFYISSKIHFHFNKLKSIKTK